MLEISRRLLKNSKNRTYDLIIPPLGKSPKKCKSAFYRDTCTPMLIEARFTIAKSWNWPGCSMENR
jgi:hypothetical protein